MHQVGQLTAADLIDTRRFKIKHDTPLDAIARTCLGEERVGRAIDASAKNRCSCRRGLTTLHQVSRLDDMLQVGQLAASTDADIIDPSVQDQP